VALNIEMFRNYATFIQDWLDRTVAIRFRSC